MRLVSKEPFVEVDYIRLFTATLRGGKQTSLLWGRWSRGERGRGQNRRAFMCDGRVMPLNTGRRLGGCSCKQLEDLGPRSAKGCVQHSLKSRLLLSTSTSCFIFLWLLFLCGELGECCQLLCCFQLELWHATACSL